MKKHNPPVFRSIDLGYGLTKFSRGHMNADYSLDVGSIPTFAEIGGPGYESEDHFIVEVGGVQFSVGSQSKRNANGDAVQFLESSYFSSLHCAAIALGALAHADVPADGTIDWVVVGLPASEISRVDIAKNLRNNLVGHHKFRNQKGGKEQSLFVKNVRFVSQQDAVISALIPRSQAPAHELSYFLVIDVGYVNLGWFTNLNSSLVVERTGSVRGGVTNLIKVLLDGMKPNAFWNMHLRDRMDEALRAGLPTIQLCGKKFEVAKYSPRLQPKIVEDLSQVLARLGPLDEIKTVYLTGGGSALYQQHVADYFPSKTIHMPSLLSHFEVIRGLQIVCEAQELRG